MTSAAANGRDLEQIAQTRNLLGAAALAVSDRVRVATEGAVGHAGSAPAAVVALSTFLDGESIDTIGHSLGLTHSAAVRLVDRLEADGLVERRPGADGRSVSVVMTRTGRRAGAKILGARQDVLEELVDPLSSRERRALAGALGKLLGSIAFDHEAAARICRLCDPDACGHHEGRCPVTRAAARSIDGENAARA